MYWGVRFDLNESRATSLLTLDLHGPFVVLCSERISNVAVESRSSRNGAG